LNQYRRVDRGDTESCTQNTAHGFTTDHNAGALLFLLEEIRQFRPILLAESEAFLQGRFQTGDFGYTVMILSEASKTGVAVTNICLPFFNRCTIVSALRVFKASIEADRSNRPAFCNSEALRFKTSYTLMSLIFSAVRLIRITRRSLSNNHIASKEESMIESSCFSKALLLN
jgi:hypothetical protein